MATYEQAKMAKTHAVAVLGGRVKLAGVGIRGSGEDYSLSAHLLSPVVGDLPSEVDGVALTYKFVGRVTISDEGAR